MLATTPPAPGPCTERLEEAHAALKAGDLRTFAGIVFVVFHPALLAFTARRLADRNRAEDVVAETFLHFWKALCKGGFRSDNAHGPRPFLFRIAQHCTIDLLRRIQRERQRTLPLPEEVGVAEDDCADEVPCPAELLHRCLEILSPLDREAFRSYYLHRAPVDELTRRLNRPLSPRGFASWMHRIRKRLRAHGRPITPYRR